MAWIICLITLAAFGLLSAVWCLLGWLLPATGGILVCCGQTDAHAVARGYLWLRGMGLIRYPLIVAVEELSAPERTWLEGHGIEVCSPEALPRRLGTGEKDFGGTGNGDPPGCHQRRGVSEL